MKDIRYSSNMMANKMWILFCIWSILFASYGTEGFIGMTWGRQSAQRLVPSQVVDLLLQNGIRHARIYSSEIDILEAFVNSGIELTVTLANENFFLNMSASRKWVQSRSKYLVASDIRHITIGRYVFDEGIKDGSIIKRAMTSMKNLQQALDEVGDNQITTNMVHVLSVLKPNILRPSEAEFRDEITYRMRQHVQILQARGSPFLIDLIPFLNAKSNNFSVSFALGGSRSEAVEDVNGAVYTGMFEFMYDSFVWALSKINASDVRVVVSQVGWPSDAYAAASAANAEQFYKTLLPLAASGRGTPMRPGLPIDIFVHSLADETRNADPLARHWGVYRSNGQPKYKIDLSGRGRDVYPTTMGGILQMPRRWCVFNGDTSDMFYVRSWVEKVCKGTDCSSAAPGGSCGQLTFEQNASYAFNMRFQFMFQNETECNFGGLGKLSVEDPSVGECVFPIEVVRGNQNNLVTL